MDEKSWDFGKKLYYTKGKNFIYLERWPLYRFCCQEHCSEFLRRWEEEVRMSEVLVKYGKSGSTILMFPDYVLKMKPQIKYVTSDHKNFWFSLDKYLDESN